MLILHQTQSEPLRSRLNTEYMLHVLECVLLLLICICDVWFLLVEFVLLWFKLPNTTVQQSLKTHDMREADVCTVANT